MGNWNSHPDAHVCCDMILDVVDGADVATKEDDVSLYPGGRHRCDAVTE